MKIFVNGKEISEKTCSARIEAHKIENPWLPEDEIKKKVADDLIEKTLIDEETQKRFPDIQRKQLDVELDKIKKKYPSQDAYEKALRDSELTEQDLLEDIASSIRFSRFVEELSKNIPPPPPQVIEEYYKHDTEISVKQPEVHAAHIVKKPDPSNPAKTFNELCEIRRRALDGANFAELANKHSSCKDKDGDLGYFSPGKMVEEFEIVVFSMKKGEISPVFKTPFGYHIAKVYDIKPQKKVPLEECAKMIEAKIINKARMKVLEDWIKRARSSADIKIIE